MNKKDLRKLRRASKKWNNFKWEEYLKSIEYKPKESFIRPKQLESTFYRPLWEKSFKTKYRPYIPLLKRAMKKLTPKQRKTLKLLFWEGLSERALALKLNLSKSGVRKRKDLAIQRLRKEFHDHGVTTSPYVEEVFSLKPPKPIYFKTSFESLHTKTLRKKIS